MEACFHQCFLGHTALTHEGKVPKTFVSQGLALSMFQAQQGAHDDFEVILEEVCQEESI